MLTKKNVAAAAAISGLVLTPLGWIPAPAAHAAGTGEFSVYVGGDSGGLSGVNVTLYNTATGAIAKTAQATSGGETTFAGLDNGTYVAQVVDPAGKYRSAFTTADTISSDDQFASESVYLQSNTVSYGKIKGTVSQLTQGDLDAYLEVYPSTVTQAAIADGSAEPVTGTYAGGYDYDYDGAADLVSSEWRASVAPGSYKVRVIDRDSRICNETCTYTRTTWVGGSDADKATKLVVQAGRVTPAAAATLPAEQSAAADGRIKGTVTGAAGAKLDDIDVDLLQLVDGEWTQVANTETGADGTFGFSTVEVCEYSEDYGYYCDDEAPLGAGTFTLRFEDGDSYDGSTSEYGTVYYNNKPASVDEPRAVPENVDTIVLGAEGTKDASTQLTQRPFSPTTGLQGRLTNDAGAATRGRVFVADPQGDIVRAIEARRDGRWSLPNTSLAPGSYKVYADGVGTVDRWMGGGDDFRTGAVYTVPIRGAANAGPSANARFAKLAGRVTVSGVAGTDASSTRVTVYDAKGKEIDSARTDSNGNYSMEVRPGTYLVSADGVAYSEFDDSDVEVSTRPLIEKFWKNGWVAATANRILARSGANVGGINIALSNQLVPTAAPRITGTAKKGKTLSVTPGAWNETDNVRYSYVWKRGSTVVSRAATYKVAKADEGKTLNVVVTASDATGTYRPNAAGTSVKVDKPKKKKNKGKGKGKGKK